MKDQVSSFTNKKLSAVYVGEASNNDDKIAQIHDGNFQVVLFSPELLLTDETWRDVLQSPVYKEHLVGFIVDEAHCVKKWQVCSYHFNITGGIVLIETPICTIQGHHFPKRIFQSW